MAMIYKSGKVVQQNMNLYNQLIEKAMSENVHKAFLQFYENKSVKTKISKNSKKSIKIKKHQLKEKMIYLTKAVSLGNRNAHFILSKYYIEGRYEDKKRRKFLLKRASFFGVIEFSFF